MVAEDLQQTVAEQHAACERRDCEECPDSFDEGDVPFRDEYNAYLCNDCHADRTLEEADRIEWYHYAYC